ncbi:hypothetical protein Pelo_4990 [Pelomyxa schiedti]|nr:hypothetical protein Pelo_4990 [Pelomyxa schiedti]
MIEWCHSTEVVRLWAEEWVIRPVRDAVFRLPLMERDTRDQYRRRRWRYLCVSVSATLGVVTLSGFTSKMRVRHCMTGPNKVLCSTTYPSDWLKSENSVIDAVTGSVCWSSPLTSNYLARANRKWVVCCGDGDGELWIWKVVGGVPVEPKMCFQTALSWAEFELSPLSEDVLMELGTRGSVTFCDLEASFQYQELITKKLDYDSRPARGVMLVSDGSMCTLHRHFSLSQREFFLVDEKSNKVLKFPPKHDVRPISKSRAFVVKSGSLKKVSEYRVFDTEGSDPTTPVLCVPCMWFGVSQQSGLIASTTAHTDLQLLQPNTVSTLTLKISLCDGISGFHFGAFTVCFDTPWCFDPDTAWLV